MKETITEKEITESDFKSALYKKAVGYDTKETVEEYISGEEGDIKLVKKKVTVKNVPPDITALKMLLDNGESEIQDMTDQELEQEKTRLIKLLKEKENKIAKKEKR